MHKIESDFLSCTCYMRFVDLSHSTSHRHRVRRSWAYGAELIMLTTTQYHTMPHKPMKQKQRDKWKSTYTHATVELEPQNFFNSYAKLTAKEKRLPKMPPLLVIRPAEKAKVFNRFPKDNKNNVQHVSIKRTTIVGGGGDGDASGIITVTNNTKYKW